MLSRLQEIIGQFSGGYTTLLKSRNVGECSLHRKLKILLSYTRKEMESKQALYSRLFGGIFTTLEECSIEGSYGDALSVAVRSKNYIRAIKMLDSFLERKLRLSVLKPRLVDWINSQVLDDLMKDCSIECLCRNGHLEMVKWYLEKYPKLSPDQQSNCFSNILKGGSLDTAKWFLEKYPQTDVHRNGDFTEDIAFWSACSNGHLDIVKWFLEKYPETPIYDAFIEACGQGHLEVVRYLVKLRPAELDSDDVHEKEMYGFEHACMNGHLEVAKFLADSYPIIPNMYCNEYCPDFLIFCFDRNLNVVDWLTDICSLSRYTRIKALHYACYFGRLDMVKLLDRKFPQAHEYDTSCFSTACERGYLDIVKYFVETYPNFYSIFIPYHVHRTRELGHTELSKWLETRWREYMHVRKNGAPIEYGFMHNVN